MKRSTLIILLVAAVGAFFVYYLEIKDAKPRDEQPASSKPAFTFKREDLASLSITRAGETTVLEAQDGKWIIKQPVNAPANESGVDSLIGDIMNARVERSITASADEIKSYGLAEPAVTVVIKLKNGSQHRIRLGSKDFSNLSVYGLIDDAREVSLLPASLATSAEKSLNDLRDLSIMGGLSQYDIAALNLKNANGTVSLAKENSDWMIKSPAEAPAEESEVSSLLSEITTARATEVASESGGDLATYGLAQPVATVNARLQAGGERQVIVGLKTEGDNKTYFAKSSDRPQIFKIDSALYDKLNLKPAQLRSKQIFKMNKEEITRVQIKNPNLTLVAEKNSEGKWMIKEPNDKKDKEAQSSKFLDPIESTRATEVLDKPSASISAKLGKPAVEARFTDKSGKTTTVRISAADGDDVYVRVDGKPEVFKVKKQLLDDLSFKAADVAS